MRRVMLWALLALAMPTAALATSVCPPVPGTDTCVIRTGGGFVGGFFHVHAKFLSAGVGTFKASIGISTGTLTGNCASAHGGICHFTSGTVDVSGIPLGHPDIHVSFTDSLSGGTVRVSPTGKESGSIFFSIVAAVLSKPGIAGGVADLGGFAIHGQIIRKTGFGAVFVTKTPEPGSLGLLGTGLIGLAGLVRKLKLPK